MDNSFESLDETINRILESADCSKCRGTGTVPGKSETGWVDCPQCKGTGQTSMPNPDVRAKQMRQGMSSREEKEINVEPTNEAKKKIKSPWGVCKAAQKKHGFSDEKYERCVKKVKKQMGESMNDIDKIAKIMAEDDEIGMPLNLTSDAGVDMAPGTEAGIPAEDEGNWVIMCHGEEDGKPETEVWGPYASKDAAIADLKDCIKDEHGDDKLAEVEGQLGSGHVEVNGWTKVIVQMKSPEVEDESSDETEKPEATAPEKMAEEGLY